MVKQVLDGISTVQVLVSAALVAAGAVSYGIFAYKKERRLFRNLKRKVVIVPSVADDMKFECDLLKRAGFSIDNSCSATDVRMASLKDGRDYRLFVLRYSDGENFKKWFEELKKKNAPIIIYSKEQIKNTSELQGYPFYALCTTPLRLVSDVFSIMSTYPEDK